MHMLRLVFVALLLAPQLAVGQAAPAARIYHSVVAHPPSARVFVLGGVTRHGFEMDLQDVWALDTRSHEWRRVGDLAPGDTYAAAYDSQSDRIVVLNLAGETWAFDPGRETWEKKAPAVAPAGRCGHRLSYDRAADLVVLFGGFACTSVDDPIFSDTWTYDYEADAWEQRSVGTGPPSRLYHGQAYDPRLGRTIIWGGRTTDERLWSFDTSAGRWQEIASTGGPAGIRSYHSMTFDPQSGLIVVFGGLDLPEPMSFGGQLTNETWLLDAASGEWSLTTLFDLPAERSHHAAVHDPETGRILIHGGELETPYSNIMSPELWSFDAAVLAWERLSP